MFGDGTIAWLEDTDDGRPARARDRQRGHARDRHLRARAPAAHARAPGRRRGGLPAARAVRRVRRAHGARGARARGLRVHRRGDAARARPHGARRAADERRGGAADRGRGARRGHRPRRSRSSSSASRRPAAARARRAAPQEIEIAWNARRSAYGALGRMHADSYTHDFATPRDRLVSSLRAATEIATRHGLTLSSVAHLGDGNLHPRLHYDAREPGAFQRALAASEELLVMVLANGGTLTGEHGIGLEKLHALGRQYGEAELDAMRARQGRARSRPASSTRASACPRPAPTRAGGCTPMSPELRAGNASLRAQGDETLAAVQLAAAAAGQFLPVDADGAMTVSELLQRRDGGPIEARYGRLRDRVLAAGDRRALARLRGREGRRRLRPAPHAARERACRVGRLPPGAAARAPRAAARARRRRLRARRCAARRSRPGPPRWSCWSPALLAIAEDCGADEHARRRGLHRALRARGGRRARDARRRRLARALRGPAARVPCAWPRATRAVALPAHDGRVGLRRRAPPGARRARAARARSRPTRSAQPASPELVARVLRAVRV